jgi:hypothetical protein
MGKLGGLVLAVGLVLVGARFKAKVDLTGRVAAYQEALQLRALGVRPGMRSTPTQAEIEQTAQALAQEFALEVSDVHATVQAGVDPVGAGAVAAEQLGGLEGPKQLDADGNVHTGPARVLKSTVASVQVHVRGKGFMCSLERDVSARRNFGYALQ